MEKLQAAGSVGGVRKGAWTKEEDILLTKCIHKFGEGRWHLVPLRAGLNRCRKSCRLRWLNYLNPNIKRGLFSKDEVDLIVRMHKLLGNRWSLIAGRIPGRTANDVKNFWNTHIHKKYSSVDPSKSNNIMITESSIIRPQPRTIPCSSKFNTSQQQQQGLLLNDPNDDKNNIEIPITNMQPLNDNDQLVPAEEEEEEDEVEECMRWWADLLETSENDNGAARVPFSFPKDDGGRRNQVNNPGDSIINIDGRGLIIDEEEDVWFGLI